jgi:hypothetical protein
MIGVRGDFEFLDGFAHQASLLLIVSAGLIKIAVPKYININTWLSTIRIYHS